MGYYSSYMFFSGRARICKREMALNLPPAGMDHKIIRLAGPPGCPPWMDGHTTVFGSFSPGSPPRGRGFPAGGFAVDGHHVSPSVLSPGFFPDAVLFAPGRL